MRAKLIAKNPQMALNHNHKDWTRLQSFRSSNAKLLAQQQ
jgi:hypothetical protein